MSADVCLVAPGCCHPHDHNITHNVGPMLRKAGLDWHTYRDQERTAAELLDEVRYALREMAHDPETYRALQADNGWGTYEQTLPFLVNLALDCMKHPDAKVEVGL